MISENLSEQINNDIIKSEIDGGVWLKDLAIGKKLQVQTKNTQYLIEKVGEKEYLISGNQKYCPEPVKATITGSTFGGSILKCGFIGRDMHLEFYVPGHEYSPITTTSIQEITEI